jgi:group I intron endonuclease
MIGIYKITNMVDGKVYIGQSWDIEKRWSRHKNRCHNDHLYRAFKKYGIDHFTFEVLRELRETPTTQQRLDALEDKYINEYGCMSRRKGYNKKGGGANGKPNAEVRRKMSEARSGECSPFYGKHLSEETRRKMSKALSGKHPSEETRRKMSEAQSGKHLSEETRRKIGEAKSGKHLSEETRRKIGEAKSGERHPLYGKHLSEETRRKLSEANSGEHNPNYGKHHSEETRRKMSEAKSGERHPFYGKHPSEETRRKLSEAKRNYWKNKRLSASL